MRKRSKGQRGKDCDQERKKRIARKGRRGKDGEDSEVVTAR